MPNVKYFKRLKLYKSAKDKFIFNPETLEAFSYRHWKLTYKVDGLPLLVNNYKYSVTTGTDIQELRSLLRKYKVNYIEFTSCNNRFDINEVIKDLCKQYVYAIKKTFRSTIYQKYRLETVTNLKAQIRGWQKLLTFDLTSPLKEAVKAFKASKVKRKEVDKEKKALKKVALEHVLNDRECMLKIFNEPKPESDWSYIIKRYNRSISSILYHSLSNCSAKIREFNFENDALFRKKVLKKAFTCNTEDFISGLSCTA